MVAVAAFFPGSATAQTIRLAPDAEVRSIEFRFTGPQLLHAEELAGEMASSAPGSLHGLHSAVAWLPFIPAPSRRRFDPVVLQQDVARLRRYYRRQGFPAASVDYAVKTDRDRRHVRITILIEEGPPLRLRSLTMVQPDSTQEIGTEEMRELVGSAWRKVRSRHIGQRFSEREVALLQSGLEKYIADQGFASARIEPRAAIDSTAGHVDLVLVVDTGARARFDSIRVEGAARVPERIVTRQLGFESGDWTSRSALERARANVLSVDLFRTARLELEKGTPADTALPVHVVVKEDRPRFTAVEGGYATDGAGVTAQVRWTHPNFTGGARSLNAIGLVQTGWWATSEIKDKLLRATLVLNQPYLGAPALSLGFGPSFEARDGYIDRSTAWSLQSTLVWRLNTLQSAALRYEFTHRVVEEVRTVGTSSGEILGALGFDALVDSLRQPVETSLLNLSTSLGGLDDIARPQRGMVLKPNLSITTPPAWGNVEFGRADLQVTAFAPLPGRSNAVMLRGNLGGLWPFGESIPRAGASPAVDLIRLRDYALTAGGANDVRGYATRMLGPKIPQIDVTISGADTILKADHYVEIGGLRRWTASVELRLGLPRLSRDIFAHVFGDAGRVWTSDPRFALRGIADDDLEVHYTTGGGLGYYTPVGAIRFDVGYKLNPSVLDLRDSQDVLQAIIAGRDPATAPADHWRRYGFHFALGLYF